MATPITTFSVRITTGKAGGAGTDGNVYIGMCGREFRIDSAIDDFERNTDNTYIFGAGSNVNNSFTNDPRSLYPVSVEDIEPFPAYIRFEPDGDKDNWQLESVTVIVNNGDAELEALGGDASLWLGIRDGLYCHLRLK